MHSARGGGRVVTKTGKAHTTWNTEAGMGGLAGCGNSTGTDVNKLALLDNHFDVWRALRHGRIRDVEANLHIQIYTYTKSTKKRSHTYVHMYTHLILGAQLGVAEQIEIQGALAVQTVRTRFPHSCLCIRRWAHESNHVYARIYRQAPHIVMHIPVPLVPRTPMLNLPASLQPMCIIPSEAHASCSLSITIRPQLATRETFVENRKVNVFCAPGLWDMTRLYV